MESWSSPFLPLPSRNWSSRCCQSPTTLNEGKNRFIGNSREKQSWENGSCLVLGLLSSNSDGPASPGWFCQINHPGKGEGIHREYPGCRTSPGHCERAASSCREALAPRPCPQEVWGHSASATRGITEWERLEKSFKPQSAAQHRAQCHIHVAFENSGMGTALLQCLTTFSMEKSAPRSDFSLAEAGSSAPATVSSCRELCRAARSPLSLLFPLDLQTQQSSIPWQQGARAGCSGMDPGWKQSCRTSNPDFPRPGEQMNVQR